MADSSEAPPLTREESGNTVLLGRFCNSPTKSSRRDQPDRPEGFALPAGALKVKNTFLCEEEDDSEGQESPPEDISRSKSAPLGALLRRQDTWNTGTAESSPSATPMVHVSELRFMEPAKVIVVTPESGLEQPELLAASSASLPTPCRALEDTCGAPSNSSTASASAVSTASAAETVPQAISNSSFKIAVKNTFIDDFADDSSEGTPSKSVKSCPARGRRSDSRGCLAPISEQQDPFRIYAAVAAEEAAVAAAAAAAAAVAALDDQEAPLLPAAAAEDLAAVASGSEEAADGFSLPASVAPLEYRRPEWSLGASLHDTGECKPCMWFWRAQGCFHAEQCKHCHLCPEGAVQERKKHRRQGSRAIAPASSSRLPLNLSALV